ncbi:hypothetical protein [Candidatus Entotheonella palauensis]|uniref:hypothetical protein n=1 Tax=Candidatus Entotheonella palauensis TaxID=93172 RepID=UPI000B7C5784|nr:hypothetical protein [Candidatus Entotheonella palauensis]
MRDAKLPDNAGDVPLVFVDGHVHIYGCHAAERVFDGAWQHFQTVAASYPCPFQGVLLLTESAGDRAFAELAQLQGGAVGRWHVSATEEANSLRLQRDDGAQLFVLAGRQLVSEERLEVSAYFVSEALADGAPLTALLAQIDRLGGMAALPWGVGKWLGQRGKKIEAVLGSTGVSVMLSDNGGRPWFWPMPQLLRAARQQGVPVLAGSDPLPKVSEEQQAGSTGFVLRGALDADSPAQDLKQRLLDLQETPPLYGKREGLWGFVCNQSYMRFRRVPSMATAS